MVVAKRKAAKLDQDRRRKHHHWRVTVYYGGGEAFARVYVDLERARGFVEREKKSPIVKRTRITRIS